MNTITTACCRYLFAFPATCLKPVIDSSAHWGCYIFIGVKAPRRLKFTDYLKEVENMPGMLLRVGDPAGLLAASEDGAAAPLCTFGEFLSSYPTSQDFHFHRKSHERYLALCWSLPRVSCPLCCVTVAAVQQGICEERVGLLGGQPTLILPQRLRQRNSHTSCAWLSASSDSHEHPPE